MRSEPAADTTGPWDMPVVEATVVESGPDPESKTIVAKLPVPSRRPFPRPSRRRSAGGASAAASPHETSAADPAGDPWEA